MNIPRRRRGLKDGGNLYENMDRIRRNAMKRKGTRIMQFRKEKFNEKRKLGKDGNIDNNGIEKVNEKRINENINENINEIINVFNNMIKELNGIVNIALSDNNQNLDIDNEILNITNNIMDKLEIFSDFDDKMKNVVVNIFESYFGIFIKIFQVYSDKNGQITHNVLTIIRILCEPENSKITFQLFNENGGEFITQLFTHVTSYTDKIIALISQGGNNQESDLLFELINDLFMILNNIQFDEPGCSPKLLKLEFVDFTGFFIKELLFDMKQTNGASKCTESLAKVYIKLMEHINIEHFHKFDNIIEFLYNVNCPLIKLEIVKTIAVKSTGKNPVIIEKYKMFDGLTTIILNGLSNDDGNGIRTKTCIPLIYRIAYLCKDDDAMNNLLSGGVLECILKLLSLKPFKLLEGFLKTLLITLSNFSSGNLVFGKAVLTFENQAIINRLVEMYPTMKNDIKTEIAYFLTKICDVIQPQDFVRFISEKDMGFMINESLDNSTDIEVLVGILTFLRQTKTSFSNWKIDNLLFNPVIQKKVFDLGKYHKNKDVIDISRIFYNEMETEGLTQTVDNNNHPMGNHGNGTHPMGTHPMENGNRPMGNHPMEMFGGFDQKFEQVQQEMFNSNGGFVFGNDKPQTSFF